MNLITFISIDPLSIEEIESTEDFLPKEELEAIKNSIYYSFEGGFIWYRDITSLSDSIQIEIPCSNIISIHINRFYLIKFETCIETCWNTKSVNPQCSISLSFTLEDLNDLINASDVLSLVTPDLFSHICLTSSEYIEEGQYFLNSLLKK